jgi:ATP/maltotriose-dependent transcriptional regulator MalT
VGAARSVLASVRALTGDLDGSDAAIAPVLRLLDGAVDEVFVPGVAHAMGILSTRRGEPATAASWFERDARSTDRGVDTWLAGRALPGLGAALLALGRPADATTVLERAVAVTTRLGMPGALAEALAAQGDLAATSPEHLERAVDLHHAALAERWDRGLRAFVPDSLEALADLGSVIKPTADDARILAAADAARRVMGIPRSPDLQRRFDATRERLRASLGSEPFDDATAEGAALGLDEAVAYVRRTRGSRGRPATGWASLTPTELEVAALVAQGLSNPEIGGRLFMSRGTVKTHLSHIFTKLDIANRTELATIADRHA